MSELIKDMTKQELQELLSTTIRDAMEEILEDIQALSSSEYLDSIQQARQDIKDGKVNKLEELVDV